MHYFKTYRAFILSVFCCFFTTASYSETFQKIIIEEHQLNKKPVQEEIQGKGAINKSSVENLSVFPQSGTVLQVTYKCVIGKKYKLKYKKRSSNNWTTFNEWSEGICYTNDYGEGWHRAQLDSLECNTLYDIKVRRKNRTTWHEISESTQPCFIVPQGSIRLKHKSTGKCIYGYTPPGSNNTWYAHTWGCWNDPKMAFSILTNSVDSTLRLKHEESGKCLSASSINGAEVLLGPCSLQYATKFELETVTNNEFRLKAVQKNQCLYTLNNNGAKVYHWQCWNDPSMTFITEPY